MISAILGPDASISSVRRRKREDNFSDEFDRYVQYYAVTKCWEKDPGRRSDANID